MGSHYEEYRERDYHEAMARREEDLELIPDPDDFYEKKTIVFLDPFENEVSKEDTNELWRDALEAPNFTPETTSKHKQYKGKDKEGKTAGARYCYLDVLPQITGFEGTTIHYACIDFNDFIMCKKDDTALISAYKLLTMRESIRDGIIKVRYDAVKRGKYKIDSYQQEMPVDDLLDAAARHMIKHLHGEERDNESGELHLSHFCANLIMIIAQLTDNR